MTQRLSTVATSETSAPWVVFDTLHATSRRAARVPHLPALKLNLRDGKGSTIVSMADAGDTLDNVRLAAWKS